MLAETIRQAVKTKGWTLRELERRSGVPYDTIYNVVHARRTDPRFSVVAKLARTLDVSLDDVAAAVLADPHDEAAGPPPQPKPPRPRRTARNAGHQTASYTTSVDLGGFLVDIDDIAAALDQAEGETWR